MGSQNRAQLQVCALTIVMLGFAGCATYTDILSKTHQAADSGDYEAGIRELEDLIIGKDPFIL